jgi:hypothetical protein
MFGGQNGVNIRSDSVPIENAASAATKYETATTTSCQAFPHRNCSNRCRLGGADGIVVPMVMACDRSKKIGAGAPQRCRRANNYRAENRQKRTTGANVPCPDWSRLAMLVVTRPSYDAEQTL